MTVEEPIIGVEGLCKSYGSLKVLDDVSFSVVRGEVFAILGPNGAGKTTCLEILEGYRRADKGSISVLGYDLSPSNKSPLDKSSSGKAQDLNFKNKIGIVVQSSGIEEDITPLEALDLYGASYQNSKSSTELLELVGLANKAQDRIGKLSGGQRRKLDLALGLVGDPDLIFLDEPTTGFSPEARREAWDMLSNLQNMGKTILLTSHYMEEVERLADRMVILLNGKITRTGRPQDLRHGQTSIKFRLPGLWTTSYREGWPLPDIKITDGVAHILTDTPTLTLHFLTQKAKDDKLELEDLQVQKLGLEDAYLKIVDAAAASNAEAPNRTET